MLRRLRATGGLLATGTLALLCGAAVTLAAPATAAATQGCSGAVCVDVAPSNPDVLLAPGATGPIDYDITVSAGQANLQFSAIQSASLSPVAGTATFDGATLPAGAVSITGQSISIDLSSVNPVAAGQPHDLGFEVTMSPAAQADQTSVATVSFNDTLGGAQATSTSADQVVELPKPDYQISADNAAPARVTAGNSAGVSFTVGGPASPPANFEISVPAGFSFVQADNNGTVLNCVPAGAAVTCPVPDASKTVLLNVEVRAAAADHIGQTGTVTVQVVPVGPPDATPANNVAQAQVQVVGTVALKVGFSSPYGLVAQTPKLPLATLPVGKPTTITMTVTNQGPDAATGVSARLAMSTNTPTDFAISFGPGIAGHAPVANRGAYGVWQIGTLGVGQTATTSVTITPKAVGDTAFLSLFMNSSELNTLQCSNRDCGSSGGVNIAVASSVASPASGDSGPELANTGSPVRAPLLGGLATVLAGAMLLLIGRRRSLLR